MYRRELLWHLLYTELFYRPSVCCCPALFVGWLCTIVMHQIKSPLPPRFGIFGQSSVIHRKTKQYRGNTKWDIQEI